MADSKKYILDGYRFDDEKTYEKAKKELERIAGLKTEKNLKDEGELRAVYDSLADSREFNTPVGIGFLREIQKRLVKNPEQRKTMKAISYSPYKKDGAKEEKIETEEAAAAGETESEGSAMLKKKIRNYRIVIVFMAAMILVPFAILAYDKMFNEDVEKEAIVNEYAAWKEELTKKEQELNEREKLFEEK